MKPAFNVKSARLDALAVHLYGTDIDSIRETLQSNIEKYFKFKALPFILDVSAIETPEALPLSEIVALFALYEINIVALRHADPSVAEYAARYELSFVGLHKPELPADLDAETPSSEAPETPESEEAKSNDDSTNGDYEVEESSAINEIPRKTPRDEDALYNDNDAVKTVEMAKQADLVDITPDEPSESIVDNHHGTHHESTGEKVSMTAAKPTIVVSAPVRTGQQIYAEQADLIVLGSVSPGAEVIADGNIHIYAPLRGRALAGASGDTNARIFVQSMQAELVSIAGIYRVFEQSLPQHLHRKPVQIELQDERLAIGAISTE